MSFASNSCILVLRNNNKSTFENSRCPELLDSRALGFFISSGAPAKLQPVIVRSVILMSYLDGPRTSDWVAKDHVSGLRS